MWGGGRLETVGISCVRSGLCALGSGLLAAVWPAERCPSILIGGPIQRNKKQAASRPQSGNLARSYCARLSPLITPTGQTRLSPNQPSLFTARPVYSLQGTPHTLACGGLNGQLPSLTAIQHHHLVVTKLTRSPISSPHLHTQPTLELSELSEHERSNRVCPEAFRGPHQLAWPELRALTVLPFDSSQPPLSATRPPASTVNKTLPGRERLHRRFWSPAAS